MLNGKLEEEKDLKVCEIPKKNEYCLANKYCPDDKVKKKDFNSPHDILFYVDRSNPQGPVPKNPESDPQFKKWDEAVEKWYKKEDKKMMSAPTKECEKDDFDSYKPSIEITTPSSVDSSTLPLEVKIDASYGVKKVTYFVDGDSVDSSSSKPYKGSYSLPSSKNNKTITLKVEVEDDNGNTSSDSKDISISF